MSVAYTPQQSSRDAVVSGLGQVAANVRAMFENIYRSVWPSQETAWLARAQLQLYSKSTRYTALGLPVAGFLIAEACSDWAPKSARLTWWLCLTLTSIVVFLLGQRIERSGDDSLGTIRFRASAYVALTVVFLMAWCSMSVFLWSPDVVVDHMFIVLILACSLAGSIAISSAHPAVAATTFVMHAAFIVGPLAASRMPLDTTLSRLAAIYVLLLAGQFYALNVATRKLLKLEHEREGLVEGLKIVTEEANRDRARAASAGRTKSQFLSNMNHELRTPMNAILGFSELIKNKSFGTAIDKYAEYAGIIHQSGQHLLGLIDDMLDLAKIESGRLGLRETEINIAQLIGDAVQTSEDTARASQISLSKKHRAGPAARMGRRARLAPDLRQSPVEFAEIHPLGRLRGGVCACTKRGGRIAFGVEDTGIGMSSDEQPNVFERFGRTRHDITTADRGTGLGLAIVKGFAEAHDGEVKLESTLGAGTRVTVYLPVERTRFDHLTGRTEKGGVAAVSQLVSKSYC